ncbi:MAG: dihydroorotase [Chitinophagaceae bacterium]|nr:dihydroorotase [Chitinophagaceae bacterium]
MDVLLRQALVIDPSSPFHLKRVDILIQNGVLSTIAEDISNTPDQEINIDGLYVSPGWLDIFSNFCDPGYEYSETLETGAASAASGGYTDVMIVPNTCPPLHNKAGIEYITQKSKTLFVTVHPIAAVTKNTEGKELAEMYDMQQSGAVAFSDGINTIQSSGILLKALQYLKAMDKIIIQIPDDRAITTAGLMNEGIISTYLGLPGKPAIGEELMVARDTELAKYTESKIHFTGISTAKSIELIRSAKKNGLNVTCSVTPYHLLFTDEDVMGYDTNFKVNPPLRTKADRDELRKAVLDGTIDCIASHHFPQHKDNKDVEFEYAKEGMINLQTCFATITSCLPELQPQRLVELFSNNPRKIFGIAETTIREKERASLSLFLLNKPWLVEVSNIKSKSANTPFSGMQLTGYPVGIINKDRVILNNQ